MYFRAQANILPLCRDFAHSGPGPPQHLAISWKLVRKGLLQASLPFHFQGWGSRSWGGRELNLEQLQQVSGIHLHVVEEEREGGMEGNYAEVQERIQCAGNKTNMQPHLEID